MTTDNNRANRKYEASAIISIPFQFEIKKSTGTKPSSQNDNWKPISTDEMSKDLGLLPHVSELLLNNTGKSFRGNDIEVYALNGKIKQEVPYFCGDNVIFKDDNVDIVFKFALSSNGEKSVDGKGLFWAEPKLVIYPLSQIGILTMPVYHYDTSMENMYKFFNKISASLAYPWQFNYKDKCLSMCEIFTSLTKGIDGIKPLCNKSLVSFIYAFNSDLDGGDEVDFKHCSEKLAYTDDRKGFVTDDEETSFVHLLASNQLYSSAGPFGASFVTSKNNSNNITNLDKYFWIYLILIVQRYSLINMLCKLNTIFGEIASNKFKDDKYFSKLQEKYQEMCEIKAGLYYTEISDQYHNMRLYHKFFEGFNISMLYKEVEEKLEALDKFVSIEKDRRNRFTQALITALLLVLTITSALNDFFDMIEDSFKMIPSIISLSIVICVIVVFWPKIKEILYNDK